METPTICKCGFISVLARDPDSLVSYNEISNTYSIALANDLSPIIAFCPLCGGRELSDTQSMPECGCGLVLGWANEPNIPIEYDSEFNEYCLIAQDSRKTILYYCPICGGHLPKTERTSLFTTPSTEEIIEINERLKSVTTMDDVVRILGEPDERYGPIINDPEKKRVYGMKDVRQGLRYTSLAKTLVLTVQENEDGRIHVIFEGKPK